MKKFFLSFFILLSALFLTTSVSAHSGCCSWHGGVRADGCGCNDGTPLSDTCAPYYTCNAPQQQNTAPASSNTTTNSYAAPIYVAPTDTPTLVPTNTPTPTLTPTPTPKPVHKTVVKKHKKPNKPKSTSSPTSSKNWWQWMFGW